MTGIRTMVDRVWRVAANRAQRHAPRRVRAVAGSCRHSPGGGHGVVRCGTEIISRPFWSLS